MEAIREIPVTRMDCPTCVVTLEKAVKEVKGVKDVRGNYLKKTLKIIYDPEITQIADIEKAIENLGYNIAYKHYPNLFEKLHGLFKKSDVKDIRHIGDSDFIEITLNAIKPVVILFTSEACPICQALKPKMKELAEQKKQETDFYEMDITQTETWKKYDIKSIPTVILFQKSKPIKQFNAMIRIDELENALKTADS